MVTRIRKGAKTHLYIKEHMDARGLNDAAIGGRLGVSATTVWRWRTQQHRLRPAKIEALAHAVGLDNSEDLYRMPGRESIDAKLKNAPDHVYEAVRDLAQRLSKAS